MEPTKIRVFLLQQILRKGIPGWLMEVYNISFSRKKDCLIVKKTNQEFETNPPFPSNAKK